MAHLGLMLSRLALMVQAAVMDSQFLDCQRRSKNASLAGVRMHHPVGV
jgi:hypothetical protein